MAARTMSAELVELLRLTKAFKRADDEFRRAKNSGTQPRLNKAGTSYAVAKWRLFEYAKELSGKAE